MADGGSGAGGVIGLVSKHRALIVPIGFVGLLVVLLVPLPPVLMDALIALNIAVAVIMLMTTMYMDEPLEFSVFPSLLLATTLLRLVLNVASTRLILTADASGPEEAVGVAGKVISSFGSFVAGGSMFVGVVIFLILVVVQFVVITKGATRISEVAARFTLDAMPGKQMAIDADLNAGVLSEREAREAREKIGREADFFGAMDGASKFVRGDAIAGIIITAINLVGGFAVGAIEKGWDAGQTAEVFSILTIGDGIASQIPSFVISIAAALIVTRSSKDQSLGGEMTGQLSGKPVPLIITAGFLALLAVTPLPTTPLLGLAVIIGATAFFTMRQERAEVAEAAAQAAVEAEAKVAPPTPEVEELLKVDTLELEIGFGLVKLVDQNQGGDLLDRITATRRQLAAEIGLVMPPVRIRDNMTAGPNTYRVKVRGNTVAEGEILPGALLAMDSGITTGELHGQPTKEPAFGLDAWWIDEAQRGRAEALNFTVVDATSVLITHLSEIVKRHADELLTREEVNNLLEQLKQHAAKLVEEVVPDVIGAGEIQKVLQALLREGVPVRDMETIVEVLGDWATKTKDTDVLVEYVRNGLKRTICQTCAVPGDIGADGRTTQMRLVCVTLDPAFEDVISEYIERTQAGTALSMPADVAQLVARSIIDALRPVTDAGHRPVVIASPQVRAQVRTIVAPHLSNVAVLGYNEIVSGIEVESMGLVSLPEPADEPRAA